MNTEKTTFFEIPAAEKNRRKWKIACSAIILFFSLAALLLFTLLMFTVPAAGVRTGGVVGGIFGGLAVLAFFSIAYLLNAIRTPTRVELLPHSIMLYSAHASREILYADIASTTCQEAANPQEHTQLVFVLAGADGKPLAKISNQIERFDELKEEVRRRVSETTGRAPETAEDDRRARLSQRGKQRRFAMIGGAAMTILGLAALVFLGSEHLNLRRLAREGTEIRGVVLRHYVHNNIAHRIEYAFTAPDGTSRTRNVMLPEMEWRKYGVLQPITVRYIPENPDFNRLTDEPPESHLLALCAGAFLVLVMGATFVMAWRGYDVDMAKGKFLLLRPGELREDRMPSE